MNFLTLLKHCFPQGFIELNKVEVQWLMSRSGKKKQQQQQQNLCDIFAGLKRKPEKNTSNKQTM